MFEVYYVDKVNPSACVHKCNTLEEAKKWISDELKGYTMVDEDHPCSEDVFYSSDVAYYEVYDGKPVVLNNDYEPNFKESVFESGFFYTH